jgi:tetratricopeptide (TPR) repeat protein
MKMICPVCNSVVAAKKSRCERCGEDLTIYRKVIMLSNRYYNEGLEKAKVRDLTGAILVLKKSLEMNKRNTNARNLLGLIYYEMGETVSALSEWVISKHLQADDNDADDYMEALQSNPTKLDALNQTIKKYNAALMSTKQGNDDLAIIQLKKVTSLNPHFVKALQLLALLYMKNGESDKALKCLVKANKIDVSNTTTLRYLHELGALTTAVKEDGKVSDNDNIKRSPSEQSLFPRTSYKEDKPNIWVFINLILGVLIGVCGLFFLVVPQVQNNYTREINNIKVEYSEEMNKQTQTISSLEKENKELKENSDSLQEQIDGIEVVEYDETLYDKLFEAASVYATELAKSAKNLDYTKVAGALSKVDVDKLERTEAVNLYNQIKDATYVKASEDLYDDGHDLYSAKKYDEALETLQKAYEFDPDNVNAIYFIGRSYHQKGDTDKAKEYYNILIENYSDTGRADEARDRMAELE